VTRSTRPLRIGVLGAARIAERAIVEPARATGHRLVAVAARDRARAEVFAEAHGVERVLDSYADLVTDPGVDVVYNPLVNGWHAPWNLAALAAGKHVLTEKPSASNAEEASAVRAAVVGSGSVFMEGFHYLFHPVTQRLLEILDSGELGDLRHVEAVVAIPAPEADDPRWSLELAGGALMDLGSYALHVLRRLEPWAAGPPRITAARGAERPDAPGVDEWLDAQIAFEGGATATASCHMAAEVERMTLRIVGSAGEATAANFVLPHHDDSVTVRTSAGERVERLGTRPSYWYQLDAFAAAVLDGTPLPIDADDALATMELIDECYRTAGFQPRPRTPTVTGGT
jgi:predicted dehydrogenase